jgi:CRISPR/Cas system endoribonuclease Cas6 (RAMP superfamily)
LGPGRGRAELIAVNQIKVDQPDGPLSIDLDGALKPTRRVTIRFVTPTELKNGRELTDRPEFGVLFARLRDRISTLRALYGDGPLEIDFRAMGARAEAIQMTRSEIVRVQVERRSSRTGQRHPLGGFVGEAEYEGELGQFVPYLKLGKWVGVGRQTVWGKGEIEVVESF